MSIQSVASEGLAERESIGERECRMQFPRGIAKWGFSLGRRMGMKPGIQQGSCHVYKRSYLWKTMTSITIKLPEELKAKLQAHSRLSGKSCSALVRRSLEKELSGSRKGHAKSQSVLEKLADLAGKGDSGIPDLATNPKYMKSYGQWRE